MKNRELAAILMKNPDLEVWFGDNVDCSEGGVKVKGVKQINAWMAGLDGDCIGDQYLYTDDMEQEDIDNKLSNGYTLVDDGEVLTKVVTILI